jgi:hypothetical protein
VCRPGTSKKVPSAPGCEPDLDAITNLHPLPTNVNTSEVAAICHCIMEGGPKARMPICQYAAVVTSIPKHPMPASETGRKRSRLSSSQGEQSNSRGEEQEAGVDETHVNKGGAVTSNLACSRNIAVSEPSSQSILSVGPGSNTIVHGAMTSGAPMKATANANTTSAVFAASTVQSLDTRSSVALCDLFAPQLHQQELMEEDVSRRRLFSHQLSPRRIPNEYLAQLKYSQQDALGNNVKERSTCQAQRLLLQQQKMAQQAAALSNTAPVLFSSVSRGAGGLRGMLPCPWPNNTDSMSLPVLLHPLLIAATETERRASASSQDAITRLLLEDQLLRQRQAAAAMMAAFVSPPPVQHKIYFQSGAGALPQGIHELALQRLTELRRVNHLPATTASQENYYDI